MSYTVDIQVLDDGDAYSNTQVRLSIGETFFPGGRLGIYGEDGWTDEDGHATFEVPEYDDYSNKQSNLNYLVSSFDCKYQNFFKNDLCFHYLETRTIY